MTLLQISTRKVDLHRKYILETTDCWCRSIMICPGVCGNGIGADLDVAYFDDGHFCGRKVEVVKL